MRRGLEGFSLWSRLMAGPVPRASMIWAGRATMVWRILKPCFRAVERTDRIAKDLGALKGSERAGDFHFDLRSFQSICGHFELTPAWELRQLRLTNAHVRRHSTARRKRMNPWWPWRWLRTITVVGAAPGYRRVSGCRLCANPPQTEAEQAAAPSAPDSGARIDNTFIVGSRPPAPADTGQM